VESSHLVFDVEQAGCESCAARIQGVVTQLAPVVEVVIDADADEATVTLEAGAVATEDDLNRVLAEASDGSGHVYRVRPGSLRLAR